MKLDRNKCHKCGGEVKILLTDSIDDEFYQKCQCEKCNAIWINFFLSMFNGYSDLNDIYDKDGIKVSR